MKICFIKSAPKKCYLAYSGGIDSSVLLHLLIKKGVDVTLLWIDHNTQWCNIEREFAIETSLKYDIAFIPYSIQPFDRSTSLECFWSRQRNGIFQAMSSPVLCGLTLDDCLEWYIMSTFQGTPKLIDYQNNNVYRPLLTTSKERIKEYAKANSVQYITDLTNEDSSFNLRNKVRNLLVPNALECFPGLRKTVARLIREKEFKKCLTL